MNSKKKYKIFIGLSETSGYYTNLNKGFKEIGQTSVFINLGGNKHNYTEDNVTKNIMVSLCQYANRKWRENTSDKGITYFFWKLLFLLCFPFVFFWAIINFNVFIFTGTKSFFNYFDFLILRLMGKKVIKVSLGSFTRQPYIDGTQVYGSYTSKKPSIDELIKMSKKQKSVVDRVDKNVDIILDHIPQACLHEKEFVNLLDIGIPFSTEKFANINIETKPSVENGSIRILHAPSYSIHKGTNIIRTIVKELKDEGYRIEYIEISNMPNEVVLKELQLCDFVIDEVYSDSPMATLTAEAAYFGKPTVVGGYFADFVCDYFDSETIPPSLFCHPDYIKESVIKLIEDKEYREKLGKSAQQYVLKHWSPKNVAEKYMKLITGDFPKEWLFNPYNIKYIYGYGLNEDHLKEVISEMVNVGGIESLQLHDKPELEKLYQDLISKKLK